MLKIKGKISDYSEENLLRAFVESGDASFFGELYRRYIPLVYGLCLKYLSNKEGAQDAVMDIFEALVEKIPQYEINNFRTWLYSVAKNLWHLGASSHSGNARGGCRGCTPKLSITAKVKISHLPETMYFEF